ncbi:trigger factor [Algiphilus sp.]|uniref:trigger factor n=1 Tax=Algiphilus sp. TaxID=1872431 RepID=UPI0025BAB29D|nr:trigger factor [Algiphilus sp.]MCK5771596.1 trigger factor [Algiphilus sp.]
MEVELQSPGGLQRVLRVSVPADRYDKAVDKRLRQIGTRARIPGFRPGKAPMKVIAQQYGDQARADAISELVRETWPEAVQQAEVNPAGQPSFEVDDETQGTDLVYRASFEVYPEIELKALDSLAVERPVAEVTEADIDRLVENLRQSRKSKETVARAAAEGDAVRIDFEGRIDGETFEGGSGENQEVEIGAGRFLPELENGLVGHAAGETFDVPVTFPDDYQAEDLKGKQATFSVTMKEVNEVTLPEIDAEFLEAHSVDPEAGVDGLRAKCREALEREQKKASRNQLKAAVMDRLLEAHQFDVPQAMAADEIGRLREETVARFQAAGLSDEQKKQMIPDELLQPQAQRRVSLGLLLGELIRAHSIELDQQRLDATLEELAAEYEEPEKVKQHYRSQPQMMQGLRAMVIEEQVVDHILASATVTDKSMPLEELLNQRQGG